MKFILFLAAAVVATNTEHCGPTDEEVGRAVLLIAPVVFLFQFGLARLLLWLWRKLRPELQMRNGPTYWALCALTALAVLAVAVPFQDPESAGGGVWEWAFATLVLAGTGILAVQLLVLRILLWLAPKAAFSHAYLSGLAFIWAAPLMAFFPASSSGTNWMINAWVWAGVWGIVPGGLLLLMLLEIWIRIRQRRRAPSVG